MQKKNVRPPVNAAALVESVMGMQELLTAAPAEGEPAGAITTFFFCPYTGSFRKNGKRKTGFMGTKFQEKLNFSAFFSRELATNLRS